MLFRSPQPSEPSQRGLRGLLPNSKSIFDNPVQFPPPQFATPVSFMLVFLSSVFCYMSSASLGGSMIWHGIWTVDRQVDRQCSSSTAGSVAEKRRSRIAEQTGPDHHGCLGSWYRCPASITCDQLRPTRVRICLASPRLTDKLTSITGTVRITSTVSVGRVDLAGRVWLSTWVSIKATRTSPLTYYIVRHL